MITYKNVLYCTDFSEDSEIALHHAVDMAKRHGARLTVLHSLHSNLRYMPTETDEGVPAGQVTDATPELVSKVRANLESRYRGRMEGLTDVEYVALVGTPFVEILRWAREHQVDLIVLGASGEAAKQPTHYGSTVEQVSKRAPCHVMAIRNPEKTYTL